MDEGKFYEAMAADLKEQVSTLEWMLTEASTGTEADGWRRRAVNEARAIVLEEEPRDVYYLLRDACLTMEDEPGSEPGLNVLKMVAETAEHWEYTASRIF